MIREFFVNEYPGPDYSMFGINHVLCILFVIISLITIYIFRNRISKINPKVKRIILISVATIMLINMIVYTISSIYYGIFDYKIHLPFHLCFISGYMFMYGIFFKNEKVLKLTFFLSFIGPIPAILWPELPSCYDYFKFWEYFISHHIFLIFSFFSYYAINYKITKIDILKVAILTNLLMFIMMPFNIIFDMNYIYSSEIPTYIVDVYPFLKYFNPVLVLETTGIVITILLYQIARKRNKELKYIN